MQDGRPPTQHHFMVVEMGMGGRAVAEVELAKDVWVDVEQQQEGGPQAEAAAAFKTKVGGDRLKKWNSHLRHLLLSPLLLIVCGVFSELVPSTGMSSLLDSSLTMADPSNGLRGSPFQT